MRFKQFLEEQLSEAVSDEWKEQLNNMSFDELISVWNEYNDNNEGGMFICYAQEFDDYIDLLSDDYFENKTKKAVYDKLKSTLKDVFWIDGYGKLHTMTIDNATKKLIAKLSTSKAEKQLS